MFGQNNPIYGQIPQASLPGVTPEMQMVAQQQTAKPKGGMFGGASIDLGRALAGYLAGIGNPAGVQALQAMNETRQRALEHQQSLDDYNRKRADDQTDWMTQEQYKLAHQPPPDIQDRISVLNGIKPGLGDTYAQNYAANGGGMGPILTNPMTGQQMVPANRAPAQEAPAEAIQRLKSNPTEAAQFDEIFGPGASAKVLGGPTQPASGGFPY